MFTEPTTDRYVYILSDGLLREKVNEGAEGAELRKWTSKDGSKSGEKWERTYKDMTGFITAVKFDEGEYGEQIQVTFEDGEDKVILTLPVASNFGEDLMKKLPAVNFEEKVTVSPYAFTADNGKDKRGVNLYQKSDKVSNFFYDFEKKEVINGFPTPEGDTKEYSKDDWKIHFLQVRKFLVKYTKERIVPRFTSKTAGEYPENDLGPVGF